jgi:acetylornithine deacetylase
VRSESTDDGRILEAVAAQRSAIERLLGELVRAPTVLGAEDAGQTLMRAAFAELGLEPRDLALDPVALRAHPGASPFSWEVEGKRNVVATWGPGEALDGGRSLILQGHIDVVSAEPATLWSSPPFEPRVDGDWLYGRGAGDMKGGLVAIVGAVAGLRALGLEPRARVELQSVVEEECTGNGALQCVIGGSKAEAAIITEPTSGEIQTSQVGVLWFQVHVTGQPAHAGEAATGRNAIEASFKLIGVLRTLEAELNAAPPPPYDAYEHPINLNVGMIRGGDWPSTVPAECVLHCRLAQYPDVAVDELRQAVQRALAAVRAEPALAGFDVRVAYDGFACEGYTVESESALIPELVRAVRRASGRSPALYPSTATTDARQLGRYGGTPTVCFGPHAEGVHGIDERVSLQSVLNTAQTLALFIRDWCGLRRARPARRRVARRPPTRRS